MARIKWKITGLETDAKYSEAAPVVLSSKLKEIFNLINVFFKDDSPENLHQLRIAVRRFRYVMEIFYNYFPKTLFKKVYRSAKFLQDLIGEGRDLDVLKMKVEDIAKDINAEIPRYFYKKIERDKIQVRQKIKIELIKFMNDKDVGKFLLNGNK